MLPDAPKLMKRATRSAKAVRHGTAILNRLKQPDARACMTKAADQGDPPVLGIVPILLAEFPAADIKLAPCKTLIGQIVRAVLAEEDYAWVERGVRTGTAGQADHVFSTGSVYEKVETRDDDDNDNHDDELIDLIVAVSDKLMTEQARKRLIGRLMEI